MAGAPMLITTAAAPVARELFLEYSEQLGISLCFQNFQQELDTLPGAYVAPRGALLAAFDSHHPAACVALRPITDSVCEMKRLFVRPAYRGTGLGRRMALAILDEGRRIGYRSIRLDTLPSMQSGIALYRSLGFEEIPPYTVNPVEGALYFELGL
jgi:putative acetyltransferase